MQRDLQKMSAEEWDLLIIGGGITGTAIARDAAFRGLRVALVEKGDFSSATSSATSKLAHGGLRYLKNLEFGLVRESLRERRYLELIAPHIVYPLPFLMPIYKNKLLLTLGMGLYDLLSFDKGKLRDPAKRLPRFKRLSRNQALEAEPGLDPQGLQGAVVYYDCQNVYPDRVALEFSRDAMRAGARCANYAKVTRLLIDGRELRGVHVEDCLEPGRSYSLFSKVVVNATGPWADLFMRASQLELPQRVRRSKGIHLVTRKLSREHALVLATKATGRVFFVLPWRDYSIVGTTDTDYTGAPDAVCVTEKDRDELMQELNEAYPSAQLRKQDVRYSYVGIRPLIEEVGKDTTQVSRKHEIYDHAHEDGHVQGLLTVMGGKWTTSRNLAEEVTDRVYQKLNRPAPPCTTIRPLSVCEFGCYSEYLQTELTSWDDYNRTPKIGRGIGARPIPLALIQTLIETYGNRYRQVLEKYGNSPEAYASGDHELFTVGKQTYFVGQVVDAIHNEMALSLDDVLRRRTGVGTLGDPGRARVEGLCRRMAQELGWNAERQRQEIERYYGSFAILPQSC